MFMPVGAFQRCRYSHRDNLWGSAVCLVPVGATALPCVSCASISHDRRLQGSGKKELGGSVIPTRLR